VKGYHAGLLFGPLVVEFCRARDSQKPQAQWNNYRYWIAGDSIAMPFLYSRQEPNAMLPKPEAHRYMPCRGVGIIDMAYRADYRKAPSEYTPTSSVIVDRDPR